MPSYFYHLTFELYPTATPNAAVSRIQAPHTIRFGRQDDQIWLPPVKDYDVFGRLPSHSRSYVPSLREQRTYQSSKTVVSLESPPRQGLIDCGSPRPDSIEDESKITVVSERQRTPSFPPPKSYAAIKPQTAAKDWRFDRLSIDSVDLEGRLGVGNRSNMTGETSSNGPAAAAAAAAVAAAATVGPAMSNAGKTTKAKYLPLQTTTTNIGWGIVHLYRESDETPGLVRRSGDREGDDEGHEWPKELDCTTLCIPAVPSYLSPSDFLGFIGERWREEVSHYRMVMTSRLNRYLVLMKFRDRKSAQLFQQEFDGKVFNDIEPETCHVAFIRSVRFETPALPRGASSQASSHDPFTPAFSAASSDSLKSCGALKPFPPPTPNLVELPTCPVCLERMDDTTGLLTIPCQHVFHCSCLQKWKGSGCPVCRHTNPSANSLTQYPSASLHASTPNNPSNPTAQPFGTSISNLCSVCDSTDDLWICLICGNVGCGRYKGGHAKEHWKDTAHTFSLELDTQHVWDYAGDMWVHRLIRDKGDGKLVELPGRQGARPEGDVVPRAKLDSIGMEYTHLLISQLESQRVYFEEQLSKAADKAAKASSAAENAAEKASEALAESHGLRNEYRMLTRETIPALEKDVARERTRASKSTDLARNLGKSLQEEKRVSEGLMKRIEHINKEVESLGEQVKLLQVENAELRDQNHDLTMFISGQEKLKEMEAEGQVGHNELEQGSAVVPESKTARGKGRKN